MSDANEPTATDERAAANQRTPIVPVNRDAEDDALDPATGVPVGQIRDESSPLDLHRLNRVLKNSPCPDRARIFVETRSDEEATP